MPYHPLTLDKPLDDKKMNKKILNKILRQAGEAYHTNKGKVKNNVEFEYRKCNCLFKCSTHLDFDTRKSIFDWFWGLANWNSQTLFIKASVKEVS